MNKPSIEELRTLVSYDPDSGKLYWKERPVSLFKPGKRQVPTWKSWNELHAGHEAFCCVGPHGYMQGQLRGTLRSHHVAWAIHYGKWPNEIDHINGDRSDNRIANLRDVDRKTNSMNRQIRSDNSTGVLGVSLRHGKWRARIHVSGKEVFLGSFATIAEAAAARDAASVVNGYHQNHGRQRHGG